MIFSCFLLCPSRLLSSRRPFLLALLPRPTRPGFPYRMAGGVRGSERFADFPENVSEILSKMCCHCLSRKCSVFSFHLRHICGRSAAYLCSLRALFAVDPRPIRALSAAWPICALFAPSLFSIHALFAPYLRHVCGLFALHAYALHAYASHVHAWHAYALYAYALHAYALHAYALHASGLHA